MKKLHQPGIWNKKAFEIAYKIRQNLPISFEEQEYFKNQYKITVKNN